MVKPDSIATARIWDTSEFPIPWDSTRRAIHSHLVAVLDDGVDPNSVPLPDEDDVFERASKNATRTNWGYRAENGDDARRILSLLDAVIENPTLARTTQLYESVAVDSGCGGLAMEKLAGLLPNCSLSKERVRRFALWLALKSPDRGAVRLAILLLGVTANDMTNVFVEFGRHEAFTPDVTFALRNSLDDDDLRPRLFDLAKSVQGWGRIRVVRQLAQIANGEIREWLLRDGYRNSVHFGYLADIAATEGKLAEALVAEGVGQDQDLLENAAVLLIALEYGGPKIGFPN